MAEVNKSYSEEELIGKGSFGLIYRAKRRDSSGCERIVAIKKIDLRTCSPKAQEHAQRETEVLQTCHHENLVKFYESFTENKRLTIVMELCNRGNLRTLITEKKGLNEEQFIDILSQIVKGLKYLHDKNIIHRDVKTTNILLHEQNGELQVKIGDFGLAKVMDMSSPTLNVGSPYFMSPEMMNGKEYDMRTDIWSLGCCAYEMATTLIPYEAKKLDSLRRVKNEGNVNSSKIPYCDFMKDLITAMMANDPTYRPSVEDIVPYLQEHDPSTHKRRTRDKGRRKVSVFAKSSPAVLYTGKPKQSGNTTSQARNTAPLECNEAIQERNTQTQDTSGYDTDSEIAESGEVSIVRVPVKMTKEESDWFAKADQLQIDIKKKLKDEGLIDKMNRAINRTKNMDSESQFLAEMGKLLDSAMFKKCRPDLKALWTYKVEILKKDFKVAF